MMKQRRARIELLLHGELDADGPTDEQRTGQHDRLGPSVNLETEPAAKRCVPDTDARLVHAEHSGKLNANVRRHLRLRQHLDTAIAIRDGVRRDRLERCSGCGCRGEVMREDMRSLLGNLVEVTGA